MEISITAANKRQVNKIAKSRNIQLVWHKKDSKGNDVATVIDEGDQFYDLQMFVKELSKLKEKNWAISHLCTISVEEEIVRRKGRFDSKYGLMFAALKNSI